MPASQSLPKPNDLVQTWKFLEDGISQIMERLDDGLSYARYMELYTMIYNYCTHSKGSMSEHSHISQGAQLGGGDLYQLLVKYLTTHLSRIRKTVDQASDEPFLVSYIHQWSQYTTAATFVHHVFKYLNRYWVKHEVEEGKSHIHDVYTLALHRWKVEMFVPLHKKLEQALFKLIERQRNGEMIQNSRLKHVLDSYVALGLDDRDTSLNNTALYQQYFEAPFIEFTKTYYKQECEVFLGSNTVVEYLKKAETRLAEEELRVDMYLHETTRKPLLRSCESVLIGDVAEILQNEFLPLLENQKYADLTRNYSLLARIPNGLTPLRTRFEEHVKRVGYTAVENITGDDEQVDPKAYADALLEVQHQYNNLVNTAFSGDSDFVKSLDNACREFVNRNKACRSSSSKSPELLARQCDALLKKSSKNAEESELERLLSNIMTIFKYIEDKDVFQKFYTRMLSKRLVGGTSASDDGEASMISKLKEACGFEYTNKLQRMFQDMGLSKDLNDAFRQELDLRPIDDEEARKIDFSILVLATSFWPLQPPTTSFNIPEAIIKPYERFQSFYENRHSGRKLNWLLQHSKGEMKINYIRNSKVGYTLQVSTYQMGILLAYNDATSYTYEELESLTGLGRHILEGSLTILVKAKVLLLESGESVGAPNSRYTLNFDFKSKKFRVNLNMPIKTEQKKEADDTHKTIEEDRKLLVQSAIVRIMKARKTLKHVALVQETIDQIKSRFTPKISDIKRSIDLLIEKEYLERATEGKDAAYAYLA